MSLDRPSLGVRCWKKRGLFQGVASEEGMKEKVTIQKKIGSFDKKCDIFIISTHL